MLTSSCADARTLLDRLIQTVDTAFGSKIMKLSIIVAIFIAVTIGAYGFSIRNTATKPSLWKSNSILKATTVNAPTTSKIVSPVFDEKCKYSGITLTRYLVEFVTLNPKLRELESLVLAIQTACKSIANVVERASITGTVGLEGGGGSINVQGEEQKR